MGAPVRCGRAAIAPQLALPSFVLSDIANAVAVGKTVITNTGCERLAADLTARGYATVAVELDEFLKAGGSAKCLTLRLDGEEAAVWD